MTKLSYFEARQTTIEYATAHGYTMYEDGCHMISPNGHCYHVDQLVNALVDAGTIQIKGGN